MKVKCNRCGQCCGPCRYLIRYIGGRTRCMIYSNRLGAFTNTGRTQYCGMRSDLHVNFMGCPYNQPDWPDFEGVQK